MRAVYESAAADQRGALRWFVHLFSCIRLDEVLILQGTPLLGALFSMGPPTVDKLPKLLVFAAASWCLVAHVFVLNDLCGASADLQDPNRATDVFMARGIGRTEVACLCALLLALSLMLMAPFGFTTVSIAAAIAALSALYSAPMFRMKGVPLIGSGLHVLGGLFQFVLGYSLFHSVDARSLEIGSFFALTFAAGHLTHEARDHASDLVNRIWTNAVTFGPARSFIAGFVLFTAADAWLVSLAVRGVVPRALLLVGGLYAVHFWWVVRTSLAGLTFENIRQLQVRYRALYAIIGLLMVIAIVDVW